MFQFDIEPFDNCAHDCTCKCKGQTFKMYGLQVSDSYFYVCFHNYNIASIYCAI